MIFLKIIFIFGFSLSLGQFCSATEVTSQFINNQDQSVSKMIQISCDKSNEQICLNTCNQKSCLIEEPICTNCIGTGDELLRILFTKPRQFFKMSGKIGLDKAVLNLIVQQKAVLIDSQSIFNLYTSTIRKESEKLLLSLCPTNSVRSTVVIILDESGFPLRPFATICESPSGQQYFLGIGKIDEEISIDEILDSDLSPEIKLKLDWEIKTKLKLN